MAPTFSLVKVIRVVNFKKIALNQKSGSEWRLCLDYQCWPRFVRDKWYFVIDLVLPGDEDIEAPLTLSLSVKMIRLENRKCLTECLQQVFRIDSNERIHFTSLDSSSSSFDTSSSVESSDGEVDDLMEARFGEDPVREVTNNQRVSGRREESGLQRGGETVPYVAPKRVNGSNNQRGIDESWRKNLNVFGFARSTLINKDIASLCIKYHIDLNTYKLSVIPPFALMTTSYTLLLFLRLISCLVFVFLWTQPLLIFSILLAFNRASCT